MRKILQRRPSSPFYLAALFTLILLGIDFCITSLLRDPQQQIIYSDVVSPLVDILACAALFIAAKQSFAQSRQLGIAWGLIAFSALAFALGDITWAILELGLSEPPFPSLADAFYLLIYPLLLAGVLLLPEKPATRGEQIKKVLDVGIVMFAALLGFWNFLMGPLFSSNADYPILQQVILLAYPVGDLVLLWALLRILYRRSDQQEENDVPAFLLAISFAVTIIADCIYTYQAFVGTYVSGGLIDISWRAGILLTGLAGIAQLTAIRTSKSRLASLIRHARTSTPYFPYFWLIAAFIILMRSSTYPMYMDFLSLSLAVGAIIGLVLLRQTVTLFENSQLNTQLRIQAKELEKANQELQNEIVERKAMEQQLTYDSLHDAMTGLPNRVLFLDRLGQAIEYCKRRNEYTFAVLFVDMDQFKVINDSLGHLTGDQLLLSAGKRMKECLRSSDTVARLGGDEFAVLLEITGGQNSALRIAEKIQEAIKRPFNLNGHELHITASIGIVMSIAAYDLPQEVLRDADIAMYQAKATGKAHFEIFDIKMRSQAFSRLELEQELRMALDNEEFQLYYQPIITMASNQLASFEALIRWCHPRRGLLLPGDFLSIAEESGLILPLGKWILNEACAQLHKWHQKYPRFQHVSINVNVSNRQFSQSSFIKEVMEALQINELKADSLKLEITESVLINNYVAANEVFTQLRNLGIQLEIDDFGSGYSALSYLQHFPISAVKIDKSFIDGIGKGRRGKELIRAIVSMTRELGMEAIAEGIETNEQLAEIKSVLCGFGQGFLLSKPLDQQSAERMLAKQEEMILGNSIV